MMIALEHRYFGQSLPFGVTSNTTENMNKALNLDNILGDAVNFVNFIKGSVEGAQDSQVIVYGGTCLVCFLYVFHSSNTQALTAAICPHCIVSTTRTHSSAR